MPNKKFGKSIRLQAIRDAKTLVLNAELNGEPEVKIPGAKKPIEVTRAKGFLDWLELEELCEDI